MKVKRVVCILTVLLLFSSVMQTMTGFISALDSENVVKAEENAESVETNETDAASSKETEENESIESTEKFNSDSTDSLPETSLKSTRGIESNEVILTFTPEGGTAAEITTVTTLTGALDYIKSPSSPEENGTYTITLLKDISLASRTILEPGKKGIHVQLTSQGDAKTITPPANDRHFFINAYRSTTEANEFKVEISNVILEGNNQGGGVVVSSFWSQASPPLLTSYVDLTLAQNTTLQNCTGTGSSDMGGGLNVAGGKVSVYGTIKNCSAQHGGGVSVGDMSELYLYGTISGNKAQGNGGGVFQGTTGRGSSIGNTSLVVIESSAIIENNTAGSSGGGIFGGFGKSLTVKGTVQNNTAINGGGIRCSIPSVGGNPSLILEDAKIVENKAGNDTKNGYGGGLFIEGAMDSNAVIAKVVNSTISGNSSNYCGGGIYAQESSSLIAENSSIDRNQAKWGGGIYAAQQTIVDLSNTNVCENAAESSGGGIYTGGESKLTLTESNIRNNNAGSLGGGIYATSQSNLSLTGGAISGNNAGSQGGGMALRSAAFLNLSPTTSVSANVARWGGGLDYNSSAPLKLSGNVFSDNLAYFVGGGLYFNYAENSTEPFEIDACTFSGNVADSRKLEGYTGKPAGTGGGIFVNSGSGSILNTIFSDNQALESGGALALNKDTGVTVEDSRFQRNSAQLENLGSGGGGAIFEHHTESQSTSLTLDRCDFSENKAISGGAAYLQDKSVIRNTTFTENSVVYSDEPDGYGGAIYLTKGTSDIKNSTFSGNAAHLSGGAVVVTGTATATFSGSTSFTDNKTKLGEGGAIYTLLYSYEDPADTTKYQNLIIDNTVSFSGNRAGSGVFLPPENHGKFTNLKYASLSSKFGSLLTNMDVNFKSVEATVDVTAKKIWVDVPTGTVVPEVQLQLKRNGKNHGDVVTLSAGKTEYTWEKLPKYAEDSREYVYTVKEVNVPDGYIMTQDGNTITNTYSPLKKSIRVTKVWEDKDNQDGIRPESVTMKLLADGQETGQTLVLTAAEDWSGAFTDLDEYADGELIAYTVEEVEVDRYTSVVSGDSEKGFVVTNIYEPKKPTVPTAPAEPGQSKPLSPKTGEEGGMVHWSLALFLSMGAMLFTWKRKKVG